MPYHAFARFVWTNVLLVAAVIDARYFAEHKIFLKNFMQVERIPWTRQTIHFLVTYTSVSVINTKIKFANKKNTELTDAYCKEMYSRADSAVEFRKRRSRIVCHGEAFDKPINYKQKCNKTNL